MNPSIAPLVSVIVPVYNMESWLEECIQGVLAQTYTHWELVLVDDGSVDGSNAICRRYADLYPDKIRVVTHEGHVNKGLSATRNRGIAMAAGEWIALLDADDLWKPAKLEQQLALVRANPAAAFFCEAACYWSSWQQQHLQGDDPGSSLPDPERADKIVLVGEGEEGVFEPPELLERLYPLGKGQAPCPSGVLLRKSTWQQVGGFEEEFRGKYGLYEDQAFFTKLYLEVPVYISGACHNYYRQRPGSIMSATLGAGQYQEVRRYYLEWFRRYLLERYGSGVARRYPGVWSLLQEALSENERTPAPAAPSLLARAWRHIKYRLFHG